MPYEAPLAATGATFIADGKRIETEAFDGESLMEAALRNGVSGITADCGGGGACGTCQIVVDEAWRAAAGEASEMEQAMLESEGDAPAGARLACQITMSSKLKGIVVSVLVR